MYTQKIKGENNMDQQCNTTKFFHPQYQQEKDNIYNLLQDKCDLEDCLYQADTNSNISFITGSENMKFFNSKNDFVLHKAIRKLYQIMQISYLSIITQV